MSRVSTSKAFDTACCPAPIPGVEEFARLLVRSVEAMQAGLEPG